MKKKACCSSETAAIATKKDDAPKNPFSHCVNIHRHRNDKNRLKIDSFLLIEDGCAIHGKDGRKTAGHAPIKLGLDLSEDDLHRLSSYADQESDFANQFSLILADAIQQNQKGARGKHKGRETTVFHIKLEAGLLYLLFAKVCDEPLHKYPPFFQKLVNKLSDYKVFIEDSGQPYTVMLTAYCLEEYYGKTTLSRLGLKPFFSDGFSHFFYTYIEPQLEICEKMFSRMLVYKGVTQLKKRGTNEVFIYTDILASRDDMIPCDKSGNELNPMPDKELSADIISTPPYKFIFKTLGII